MTKAVFTKRGSSVGGVLIPADEEARDLMASLKDAKDVMVEVKPARNPRHHRLFWALMQLVADNVEGFASAEHVSVAVRLACHEVDMFIMPDTGDVRYVPRSLKYESMDQAHFNRFFERAMWVICNRWLVGSDVADIRARVFELVDGPAAIGSRAA